MADTIKVLGQSNPSATTNTDLYTVPSDAATTTSSLVVCNQTAGGVSYRIAIRPAGEALALKHYIAYDKALAANESYPFILGMTLAATDVVTIYASSASMSFNLFGVETTRD